MFEAPQVVFTPNSSRSRRTNVNTCKPALPIAPTGITSGSTTMSCAGIPKSAARSTIFLATANLTSGSSEIPVSSFEIATTGTLYFLTNGNTKSSLSSSPVTELSRGRPSAAARPFSKAPGTELSMHSGVSTTACTRFTSSAIKVGSTKLLSAYRGSSAILFENTAPELISKIFAPAAV